MTGSVPYKMKFSTFDGVIIGIAVVFFPLSLILALIRLTSTHHHKHCRGRNYRLFGWVFVITYLALMSILFLASMNDLREAASSLIVSAIVLAFFTLLPALVFFSLAKKEDAKFNSLMQYYNGFVTLNGQTHVDRMAAELNLSPDNVIRDIEFMMKEHLMPAGSIRNGSVEFTSYSHYSSSSNVVHEYANNGSPGGHDNKKGAEDTGTNNTVNNTAKEPPQPKGPRSVECPSCGSKVVIHGNEEKECEYCGNMIVA